MDRLSELRLLTANVRLADLRAVCFHEAGHAAVARHFGLSAEWSVRPDARGDLLDHKFFSGDATIEQVRDEHVDRLIGLAGSISEAMRDTRARDSVEEVSAWIWERLSNGVLRLSPTDAASAGKFLSENVVEVVSILREHWTDLCDDVEQHMRAEGPDCPAPVAL